MFSIDTRGNITLSQGNTAVMDVVIRNSDGTEYEMQVGDIARLTVKKSVYDTEPLLQKIVTEGAVHFEPTDTANISFGTYVYDIELTQADGKVFTVQTPRKFVIGEVVT